MLCIYALGICSSLQSARHPCLCLLASLCRRRKNPMLLSPKPLLHRDNLHRKDQRPANRYSFRSPRRWLWREKIASSIRPQPTKRPPLKKTAHKPAMRFFRKLSSTTNICIPRATIRAASASSPTMPCTSTPARATFTKRSTWPLWPTTGKSLPPRLSRGRKRKSLRAAWLSRWYKIISTRSPPSSSLRMQNALPKKAIASCKSRSSSNTAARSRTRTPLKPNSSHRTATASSRKHNRLFEFRALIWPSLSSRIFRKISFSLTIFAPPSPFLLLKKSSSKPHGTIPIFAPLSSLFTCLAAKSPPPALVIFPPLGWIIFTALTLQVLPLTVFSTASVSTILVLLPWLP